VTDTRKGVDASAESVIVAPITDRAVAVDWDESRDVGFTPAELETEPVAGAEFAPLPDVATKPKSYDAWRRDGIAWLAAHRPFTLLRSPSTGLTSRPGEPEGAFRVRVTEASHEARDEVTERLRKKYAPKIATLQERIRRAEQAVARESAEASTSQLQTVISVGATLIGAFLGRKAVSTSTLGRATTAARGVGRAMKDRQDIARATETVEALRLQLSELEAAFRAEIEQAGGNTVHETFERVEVRASRANVAVELIALAWAPWWRPPGQAALPAWE
jgi:hypothetical protein